MITDQQVRRLLKRLHDGNPLARAAASARSHEGPYRLRLERIEAFDLGVSIQCADLARDTAERLQAELLASEARRCRVVVTDACGRTVHVAKGAETPAPPAEVPARDHVAARAHRR